MNNSGTLNFGFQQSTGYTFYNTGFACLFSSSNVSPSSALYFRPPQAGVTSSAQIYVGGLPCYSQNGYLSGAATGSEFSGYIWVNYTLDSGQASQSNPAYFTKFATVQVYVTNGTAGSNATTSSSTTVAFVQTSTLTTVIPPSVTYKLGKSTATLRSSGELHSTSR
jgi:hypothetical protein